MGYYAMAGVPQAEIESIRGLVHLSKTEADLLTSWSTPEAWDPNTGQRANPPGLGKIMFKVGGRPGLPVQVNLTKAELAVNDTNSKWVNQ